MAKPRSAFFCSACGYEAARWLGRCPGCEAWNTFAEAPVFAASRAATPGTGMRTALQPTRIADVDTVAVERLPSGFAELDAVLGGGVVPGSLVLIGGPPGTGKSTMVLQMAGALAVLGRVVYVCGEESPAQTKLRALRLGIDDGILLFAETNLRAVLETLEERHPRVLVIDSIQTMMMPDVESYAGSVAQVRECAGALMAYAKRTNCATFIVGHVTKDGTIAGPRLLEHLVDTVLYFEGDGTGEHRIVRAHKNRFGSAEEICVFRMDGNGLHEVRNPSQLFLGAANARDKRPSGSCVVASVVGQRPVLVEVQALVGDTGYGTPRRLAANLDPARLAMVLAVLERRAGMNLGTQDVYASVAGGLRITEPAADLGIALAIASAFRNRPVSAEIVAFGELGLSGEVRPATQRARRLAEAQRLGFRAAVTSASDAPSPAGLRVTGVRDVFTAISAALDE
ncbi:MAG: DNA repair protein RadA [Candidatus Eremiobacteraeota bacterium]|nr:DNA repair protein RadA [Candidatus Eremiobacteraeota bacterium]